jgi:hypothetical protein
MFFLEIESLIPGLPSSSSTLVATGFSGDSAATWSDTSEGTFAATMFRNPDQTQRELVYRPLQLQKRSQHFVSTGTGYATHSRTQLCANAPISEMGLFIVIEAGLLVPE